MEGLQGGLLLPRHRMPTCCSWRDDILMATMRWGNAVLTILSINRMFRPLAAGLAQASPRGQTIADSRSALMSGFFVWLRLAALRQAPSPRTSLAAILVSPRPPARRAVEAAHDEWRRCQTVSFPGSDQSGCPDRYPRCHRPGRPSRKHANCGPDVTL